MATVQGARGGSYRRRHQRSNTGAAFKTLGATGRDLASMISL